MDQPWTVHNYQVIIIMIVFLGPSIRLNLILYSHSQTSIQLTPDILPIVDVVPGHSNLLFAAGFSGIQIAWLTVYTINSAFLIDVDLLSASTCRCNPLQQNLVLL